jgi:hypothetical protein
MKTRGWTVRVAAGADSHRALVSRTFVTVLDEEIAFGLEERSKRVPHVLTAYEKDGIKRGYKPYHRVGGRRAIRLRTEWIDAWLEQHAREPASGVTT